MPIKGLTDRGLSFPEIGVIRKGAKKTDPRRPGEDLKYFRVEFDEQEGDAAATFHDVYGLQPQTIRIILPFNDIEKMWDAWLEGYTAGRMVARSDGEFYVYLVDTTTGEILVKNGYDKNGSRRPYIEGEPCGYYKDKQGKPVPVFCKQTGRLKVILPELGRAAYLTVLTTSIHDIANISDQLRAFQQLNNGRIAGIPLLLRRRPKAISTPNQDGTRARRTKYMLSIEADPEWVRAAIGEVKRLALPGGLLPELPDPEPLPGEVIEPDEDEAEGEDMPEPPDEMELPEGEPEPVLSETARTMANKDGVLYLDLTDQQLNEIKAELIAYSEAHEGTMTEAQAQKLALKLNAVLDIQDYRAAMDYQSDRYTS